MPAENVAAIHVLICHPHPLYGGTQDNKVITTLARTVQQMGMVAWTFNYRGVGSSAGVYGHAQGELQDALTVYQHIQHEQPGMKMALCGFSFGADIAVALNSYLQSTLGVEHCVMSVAPPLRYVPDDVIFPQQWHILQAGADEVIDNQSANQRIAEWVAQAQPSPLVQQLPEASHFFHGQLGALKQWGMDVLRTLRE